MKKTNIIIIFITIFLVVFVIIVSNKPNINKNAKLSDITNEKVNIYLFWGDGCPHCKQEFEWLDKQDKKSFNLYGFEVWHNKDNVKIMNKFSKALNEEVTGVPYTVIGNKSYTGFNEDVEKEITKAINNKNTKKNDIYLNKIKK